MLRIAVDLRRGMSAPELEDPLGDGPLVVHGDADGWHVRSAFVERDEPRDREVLPPPPR